MKRPPIFQSRRGSAMILSMWALLLLSATVLAWFAYLDRQITFAHQANSGLEARAMAYSGVNVALAPQTTKRSPLLARQVDGGHGYEVKILGEGGRLNLNWLLAGEDPGKLELLKNFFTKLGLDFKERETLVDSLLDWVDADSEKRLNGREADAKYIPTNRALQSVEEVAGVAGAGALTRVPDWQKYFTVLSRGPIDVMSADQSILSVIPGVGDDGAERFLKYRRGEDEIDNTEDDPAIDGLNGVRNIMGFSKDQFEQIQPLLSFDDATWRIVSVGRAQEVYRQVEVVARKMTGTARVLYWQEF